MLRTFETEEEKYKKFKEICLREGQKVGDKLNEMMEDYIKEHGDGNPAFTLDQFQDPNFRVCPAFFRKSDDWYSYLMSIPKEEFLAAWQQKNTIISAFDKADKARLK